MSAGPGVHINLCRDISSKFSRETLSNSRVCSILALDGCVAQTVVRLMTSWLQTVFKMLVHLSHVAKEAHDNDAWLNSADSTRATQRLDNTNPKTNQRVPLSLRKSARFLTRKKPALNDSSLRIGIPSQGCETSLDARDKSSMTRMIGISSTNLGRREDRERR